MDRVKLQEVLCGYRGNLKAELGEMIRRTSELAARLNLRHDVVYLRDCEKV